MAKKQNTKSTAHADLIVPGAMEVMFLDTLSFSVNNPFFTYCAAANPGRQWRKKKSSPP